MSQTPNFPGNSYKGKPEENPTPGPKAKGVVIREKGFFRRVVESFYVGDAQTTKEYVIFDILIPALKDLVFDMINGATSNVLFDRGTTRGRGRGAVNNTSYVSYNAVSKGTPRHDRPSSRMSSRHDFSDYVLPNRVEAELALEHLTNILDEYDVVTVRDLYSYFGTSHSSTDLNWGWKNLNKASVNRLRQGGYTLDLPPTIPLD